MGKAVFNKATGLFVRWAGRRSNPANAPATEVVVKLSSRPDPRTKRWDGAAGIRNATQTEMDQYDANQEDTDAQAIVDRRDVKALAMEIRAEFATIAAQVSGYTAPAGAAWRQRIVDRWKTLG